MSNENTNIEDYSIPELMKLLEIDNLTTTSITQKANTYIQKFRGEDDDKMATFFQEVKAKLLFSLNEDKNEEWYTEPPVEADDHIQNAKVQEFDTNINNYDYKYLLEMLSLSAGNFDIDDLFTTIHNKIFGINKENGVLEKADKDELMVFFKNIFYKICHKHGWVPPKHINSYFSSFDDNPLLEQRFNNFPDTTGAGIPFSMPRNPVINTAVTEYTQGLVNPLKRETITNTLIINSKFMNPSNNATSTDFTIDVKQAVNNVISLKVASVEIANTYYNISEYHSNNSFCICTLIRDPSDNVVSGPHKKLITIKDGAYNVEQLVPEINRFLINGDDPFFNIIECFFDLIKGKVFFKLNLENSPGFPPTIHPDSQFEFNLYFDNTVLNDDDYIIPPPRSSHNRLGYLLGFTKSAYIFKTHHCSEETNTKLVGMNPERCVDLSGTKFFLLEVDDFNKNAPAVLLYVNDNFQGSNILAKIPNVSNANEVIFEDSSDNVFKTRRYFGPIDLKRLKIRLLDEYGNVLDFKNADLIITFEVERADSPYKDLVYKTVG